MQLDQPKNRNLFLSDQVTQETIKALTKDIVDIQDHDNQLAAIYSTYSLVYTPKPIKIYIDSYGGLCYQCMGLLSIMDKCTTEIHTIVTGCAMSCGFLIAINGHKRFAHDRSTLLYHQVSSGYKGKLKDIQEDIAETNRLQKEIERLTLSRTKITKSKLKDVFIKKTDWFIPAKQALKLGCIDEIL